MHIQPENAFLYQFISRNRIGSVFWLENSPTLFEAQLFGKRFYIQHFPTELTVPVLTLKQMTHLLCEKPLLLNPDTPKWARDAQRYHFRHQYLVEPTAETAHPTYWRLAPMRQRPTTTGNFLLFTCSSRRLCCLPPAINGTCVLWHQNEVCFAQIHPTQDTRSSGIFRLSLYDELQHMLAFPRSVFLPSLERSITAYFQRIQAQQPILVSPTASLHFQQLFQHLQTLLSTSAFADKAEKLQLLSRLQQQIQLQSQQAELLS